LAQGLEFKLSSAKPLRFRRAMEMGDLGDLLDLSPQKPQEPVRPRNPATGLEKVDEDELKRRIQGSGPPKMSWEDRLRGAALFMKVAWGATEDCRGTVWVGGKEALSERCGQLSDWLRAKPKLAGLCLLVVLLVTCGLYLQGRNVGENDVMVDTIEISASSAGDMEVRAPRFPKDDSDSSKHSNSGAGSGLRGAGGNSNNVADALASLHDDVLRGDESVRKELTSLRQELADLRASLSQGGLVQPPSGRDVPANSMWAEKAPQQPRQEGAVGVVHVQSVS